MQHTYIVHFLNCERMRSQLELLILKYFPQSILIFSASKITNYPMKILNLIFRNLFIFTIF